MANYANLLATIAANIKANNNQEITGPVLQSVLNQAVASLGAGYQYMGVATPATNPGTPDQRVFYFTSQAGTYPNFGDLVVADGEVAVLKYDSTWSKDVTGAATTAQIPLRIVDVDDADLMLSDEYGNVLIKSKNGHIQTKNFNSKTVGEKLDTIQMGAEVNNEDVESCRDDMQIADPDANVLMKVKGGHIQTKNFYSKDVLQDIDDLKRSTSKVYGRSVVTIKSVLIEIPSRMVDGDISFDRDGSFYRMNGGVLAADSTYTNYVKENKDLLIFLCDLDGQYYIYDNGTMYLYCERVPRVTFTLDDTLYDMTAEAPDSWDASTLISKIYAKFDALLQSAPPTSDLDATCRLAVEKIDMVDFLNANDSITWAYPAYNDGVTSNMYVISNKQSFRAGYNLGFENQKHRILLLGGVHGNERLCQFNTYLFAKQLLSKYKDNQNLYNILMTCDVYIIPVVNVYGSINATRWNGNGVNIERNFSEEWAYDSSVQPFSNNYMGTEPDSEFETKVIIKLIDIIKPDIVVDHHSYYQENQNLYCYTPSIVFSNAVFKIGCNLGRLLNKHYNQYYGDGAWYPTNGATTNLGNGIKGAGPLHYYETKKIMPSGIMEVAESISYLNGEYDLATSTATRFSSDVLSIAEYTLRTCIENLLEWVMMNNN